MKFTARVDQYLLARQRSGHIGSQKTVKDYRSYLHVLAADVDDRDPATLTADEIEVTLYRWANPNTYNHARTIYNGFYKWLIRRKYATRNPIDMIEAPRARARSRRRLIGAEVRMMMDACRTPRETRAVFLTGCAGLRNAEACGMHGRHFARSGFIWVAPDVAKGGRERWIPVSPDLQPVVDDIRANVALDEPVIPSLRSFNPGTNSDMRPVPNPISTDGLGKLIGKVAARAGIDWPVAAHTLRHYFGERMTAAKGIHIARALLGHASIQTTQIYAGEPSLDELTVAVAQVQFRLAALPKMGSQPFSLHGSPLGTVSQIPAQARAFGQVLVDLRQRLRPLTFGWPEARHA